MSAKLIKMLASLISSSLAKDSSLDPFFFGGSPLLRKVRLWELPGPRRPSREDGKYEEPVAIFQGKNAFRTIAHHRNKSQFATGGAQVDVWDRNRSEPISTFSWGADTVVSVRFNPSEPDIIASTASDRSVALYDLRMSIPLTKLVMQTRANAVAWNPHEAFNFTVANEDCTCYSYDLRKLKSATCIHKDHVSAVRESFHIMVDTAERSITIQGDCLNDSEMFSLGGTIVY